MPINVVEENEAVAVNPAAAGCDCCDEDDNNHDDSVSASSEAEEQQQQQQQPSNNDKEEDLQWLSQRLLLTVKKCGETKKIRKQLQNVPFDELLNQLNEYDGSKLVFWINIYNSYFQILRKELQLSSKIIYRSKSIPIATKLWSLDDIEHGVLRSCTYKYGYGYIPNYFLEKHVRKVAMSKVDWRIHFALNCGAKSCPMISYYSPKELEMQLKRAAYTFLIQETDIVSNNTILVSKLFYWFYRDFGGKRGIKQILKDIIDADSSGKKLKYNDYSWEEKLDNYAF